MTKTELTEVVTETLIKDWAIPGLTEGAIKLIILTIIVLWGFPKLLELWDKINRR